MLQMLIIDADEARAERLRAALSRDFSLVIVPTLRQGEILLQDTLFDAILFCGGDPAEAEALLGRGMQVLTLSVKGDLSPAIYAVPAEVPAELAALARHVAVTRALLSGLTREKAVLQKKLEDMALQNRAKALLCRTLGFTEQRAHKYLEQQAMTMRITKTEAARRVLATYEN